MEGSVQFRAVQHEDEARSLANYLLDEDRSRPVCVVTVAEGEQEPFVDIDAVARSLGDGFDYYMIPSGPLTLIVQDRLPRGANVFNGASRIYPVENSWQVSPFDHPIVFCRSAAEGAAATSRLIKDGRRFGATASTSVPAGSPRVQAVVQRLVPPSLAMAQTSDGDYVTVDSEQVVPGLLIHQLVRPGQVVEGMVDQASRALLVELPAVDVKALDAYTVGSWVLGRVVETLHDRLLVELLPGIRSILMREDLRPPGKEVSAGVFPSERDVIVAQVARRGRPGGKPWKLQVTGWTSDVDVLAAPALFPDGPPWLAIKDASVPASLLEVEENLTAVESQPEPDPGEADEEQSDSTGGKSVVATDGVAAPVKEVPPAEVAGPSESDEGSTPDGHESGAVDARSAHGSEQDPGPVVEQDHESRIEHVEAAVLELRASLEKLRRHHDVLARQVAAEDKRGDASNGLVSELLRQERDEARSEVRDLAAGLRRVEAERDRMRADLAMARKELKQATKQTRQKSGQVPGPAFLDREENLRWEVYRRWVERIPAAEKGERPLGEFVVLSTFLPSLESLSGFDQAKVFDAIVDIATGRVHELAGYRTHQLRESEQSDRFLTRDDGATCWRVALQVNTPSARRLHYWQPPGGRPPELSSVRLHDDARP